MNASRQVAFIAADDQLARATLPADQFDATTQFVAVNDLVFNAADRDDGAGAERHGDRQPVQTCRDPGSMTLRKILRCRQRSFFWHGDDNIARRIPHAQRVAACAGHASQGDTINSTVMRNIKMILRMSAGGYVSSEKAQHRA